MADDIATKLKEQAQALLDQAAKMSSTDVEIGEETPTSEKTSKMYVITKAVILAAFVLFGIVGIIGSCGWIASFQMTSYVLFLEKYAWIWGPFVVSIAGGRSIKRIAQSIDSKNTTAPTMSTAGTK
jgi:hypothetical protein